MTVIPYVIENTGRGERSMDIYSRLLVDRIVLIGSEINDQVANTVIAQLLFLMTEDSKKDISIFINSPGGVVTAGLAIYDVIRFLGCDIKTHCIGQATSIAALLLSAGTRGKRYALPNSRMMIHQPYGGVGGTSSDIELQAKEIIKVKQQLAMILSECTQKPIEKILEISDRDYFMSPQEAIQLGLIDEVIVSQKVALGK